MIVGAFETKQFEGFPRVEEEAEFRNSHAKKFGKEEVATLGQENEDGESQDELQGSNEEYFHGVYEFLVLLLMKHLSLKTKHLKFHLKEMNKVISLHLSFHHFHM